MVASIVMVRGKEISPLIFIPTTFNKIKFFVKIKCFMSPFLFRGVLLCFPKWMTKDPSITLHTDKTET